MRFLLGQLNVMNESPYPRRTIPGARRRAAARQAAPRRLRHTDRCLSLLLIALIFHAFLPATLAAGPAPPKTKLRGYLTGRIDDSTVAILDDHIQLAKGGRVEPRDAPTGPAPTFATLTTGELVGRRKESGRGNINFPPNALRSSRASSINRSTSLLTCRGRAGGTAASWPRGRTRGTESRRRMVDDRSQGSPRMAGQRPLPRPGLPALNEVLAANAAPAALYAGRQVRYSVHSWRRRQSDYAKRRSFTIPRRPRLTICPTTNNWSRAKDSAIGNRYPRVPARKKSGRPVEIISGTRSAGVRRRSGNFLAPGGSARHKSPSGISFFCGGGCRH